MKARNLDLLGISAAIVCLIHCLLFPLLMIIPLGIAHNAYIDLSFFIIGAIVVAGITKTVESKILKYTFWISITMIGVSVLLDILFHIHSPLIYIGAALLIVAHLINFKNHKH